MISAQRSIRHFLLVIAGIVFCASSAHAGWETVRHKGQDYVTARSIKTFYGFKSMKVNGRFLELENAVVKMKFTISGQEVFMNNVMFVFSFKILRHQGRYLVSRIDLGKLVDPVLRPSYIPGSTPFQTVIIDPGHGGKDSGAVNRYGVEKNYNLVVARMLKKDLEARRFKVIMTRDSDRFLSLAERVKFANRFANAIFISIHFNSGGSGGGSRAEGIETFTLSPAGVAHYGRGVRPDDFQLRKGNAQDSANIALATAVHGTCLLKSGRPDRGIRRARFSVLTGIKHPAILLEGGFMSHSHEARLIADERYQKTISRSIADAIVKYRLATTRRLGQQ
jgi:N-acetylmuramoyl-L-alanine amidase